MYKELPAGGALAVTGFTFLGLSLFWTVFMSVALVLIGLSMFRFFRQATTADAKFGA